MEITRENPRSRDTSAAVRARQAKARERKIVAAVALLIEEGYAVVSPRLMEDHPAVSRPVRELAADGHRVVWSEA